MITVLYDPARNRYLAQRGEWFALLEPVAWSPSGDPVTFKRVSEYQKAKAEA